MVHNHANVRVLSDRLCRTVLACLQYCNNDYDNLGGKVCFDGSAATPLAHCWVQVAANTMVGGCVRLMDEVRGVPGVTWQTLYEEGIFNPLFVVRIPGWHAL